VQAELSIAFQSDRRPADYTALAQLLDGYAFDRVSVYNDLFFQPSLGPLLWMAPYLRRARLGPAALNPYLVHPVELAGQAALLDLASHGRAYLGLTRGAWLGTLGVSTERPLTALREAILIVRALLEGREEGVAGRVYRLAPGARLRYTPLRGTVPIMLGTWGRATARLAGELADEIKVGGSANPAMVAYLAPSVAAGVASAARPPVSVGICLGTVTVVDPDRELARARARQALALYLPVVAPLDPTVVDRDWLARLHSLGARDDADGIARLITDDVLDRFAFAGDPASIVGQVEALLAAGASRVEFGTPHGVTDPAAGIRLLGEQVLPNVQR
jgi:5,10-methylenetetrahydromethanopterin reductase